MYIYVVYYVPSFFLKQIEHVVFFGGGRNFPFFIDHYTIVSLHMEHSSFSIFVEPIYHPVLETYQRAITLSCKPTGVLSSMVRRIPRAKLSPFQCIERPPCAFVILRDADAKMSILEEEDIPDLLAYLHEHGYHIDTPMTTLARDIMKSGTKKLVALVHM